MLINPKKNFGTSKEFKPMAVLATLVRQCSTNMSYEDPYIGSRPICWVPITTATIISSFKFVFPQFTSSSCFIPFTGTNELTKLACSQCMGLQSSTGRALQCWHRGHGFESRWRSEIFVFGSICNWLNRNYHCDDHIFI